MYSAWCKTMSDNSATAVDAYNYYRLMQFWIERGL